MLTLDPNSAKKWEKNLKEVLQKKEGLSIKKKMEMPYEKVLEDQLIYQDNLTKTERVKVSFTQSNYIFPKTKSELDKLALEKLKQKNEDHFN